MIDNGTPRTRVIAPIASNPRATWSIAEVKDEFAVSADVDATTSITGPPAIA
jgi:hypothetical protein